jgi:RNA polymerase sigma-70 factor (ECF subfamily)
VILLKFLGRLSNAELGRVLHCSESNAGTRLHRAIERLREVCGVTR